VRWVAETQVREDARAVLQRVLETPVSPELVATDPHGGVTQKTEEILGPYELHDFFLWYFLRIGAGPAKTAMLAEHAFAGRYDAATIRRWLKVFTERFFGSQFKRSVMPDGPKVGSVALSPRGDWRMPSDASREAWMAELAGLEAAAQRASRAPAAPRPPKPRRAPPRRAKTAPRAASRPRRPKR